jgi:DNA polymerase
MSPRDPTRAIRQLLDDWALAGLTHVPNLAAIPSRADPQTPLVPPTDIAAAGEENLVEPVASSPSELPAIPDSMPRPSKSDLPSPTVLTPIRGRAKRGAALEQLAGRVAACVRCRELAETRTQTVFGVGNPEARVMFIGEAPGADEDAQGEPFVGRAGQLLNRIITACGWQREDLYICNILRCRPPGNRNPLPAEAANCREYLDGQIAIVDPDYIVCWGSCAAQNLLGTTDSIGKLRGRFFQYNRARVLCTYHPSYLLRNPEAKKPVWEDMQLLLKEMGLKPPPNPG